MNEICSLQILPQNTDCSSKEKLDEKGSSRGHFMAIDHPRSGLILCMASEDDRNMLEHQDSDKEKLVFNCFMIYLLL